MKVYFPISGAIILRVTGRDSERYLHARLTNNIKALPVGQSCLAAALTPLGKTQVLMTLLRVGSAEFLLWVDGGEPSQVVGALKQYLVADRVEVEDRSDSLGVFHLSEVLDPLTVAASCPVNRGFGPGLDCLVLRTVEADFTRALQNNGWRISEPSEILLARIKANLPRFPEEINENHLFADANLGEAVAINKGCYVGHEVIERVDARGKAPHRIIAIFTKASVTPTAQVKSAEKTLGTVITVAPFVGCSYCFAYIKNIPDVDLLALNIDGAEASLII